MRISDEQFRHTNCDLYTLFINCTDYTHTHTHIYIYVYVYIYIWKGLRTVQIKIFRAIFTLLDPEY